MGMEYGRICEVCTYDESRVGFWGVPADFKEPGAVTYCMGCGAVYAENQAFMREATQRFRAEHRELIQGPGRVIDMSW